MLIHQWFYQNKEFNDDGSTKIKNSTMISTNAFERDEFWLLILVPSLRVSLDPFLCALSHFALLHPKTWWCRLHSSVAVKAISSATVKATTQICLTSENTLIPFLHFFLYFAHPLTFLL